MPVLFLFGNYTADKLFELEKMKPQGKREEGALIRDVERSDAGRERDAVVALELELRMLV